MSDPTKLSVEQVKERFYYISSRISGYSDMTNIYLSDLRDMALASIEQADLNKRFLKQTDFLNRENQRLHDALRQRNSDAERYVWLKANHLQTGPDSWIRTGDDLEDAIDAAVDKARSGQ